MNTNGNGEISIQLTDILGTRTVTLTVDGETSPARSVTFGADPLSKFGLSKTGGVVGTDADDGTDPGWYKAYKVCNGGTAYGGNPADWTVGQDGAVGILPGKEQLGAVSGSGGSGNDVCGNRAALHAGWGVHWYWTGEADNAYYARVVSLDESYVSGVYVGRNGTSFVCPR